MSDDDLFLADDQKFEIDPGDLGPIVQKVMTLQLAKELATKKGYGSWTSETELQEAMSSLLASCYGRGLKTIRVIATRKSGQKVARDLQVDLISKSRRLS